MFELVGSIVLWVLTGTVFVLAAVWLFRQSPSFTRALGAHTSSLHFPPKEPDLGNDDDLNSINNGD